jgi:hypothetical protein
MRRFFRFLIIYIVGRTPWTGDQPHRKASTYTEQQRHRINAHNTDIHTLIGIRTHDPSVRASEDSSCLRPCRHCDRRMQNIEYLEVVLLISTPQNIEVLIKTAEIVAVLWCT